ncbi:hypothetical protein [Cloacibacterium sp.]|uniref:hypothetical protein n=1 Tax=Cloacibacterium sp. TaxID=1913682 RepID=UPI0039E29012
MSENKLHNFFAIILIAILSALIAGIYGIIHDQITFTISSEYYTKYIFLQYNLVQVEGDSRIIHPRILVVLVTFLSTWWFPLISGLIIVIFNLIQNTWKMFLKTSVLAMLISSLITVFSAIIGFILGSLIISKLPKYYFADWCFIPDKLNDYENYITAGTMDAFNFFGGILGLIVAIFYSYKKRNL